jgi:Mg-chelatase subunit ChlD
MSAWLLLACAITLSPVLSQARDMQPMPLDAIILMDDSGSMRQTDPLKLRFSAVSLLMRLLRNDDAVGVVKFDDAATVMIPLRTINTDEDRQALDKVSTGFATHGKYTNIYTGLQTALQEVQQRRRQGAAPVVILISDGLMDVNPASGIPNEEATRRLQHAVLPTYQQAQVRVVTLALSPMVDRALLQDIATMTGGHFFDAPDTRALSQALFQSFDSLKAPDLVPVRGQRVTIDPAVKEATFFIRLEAPRDSVALVRPDGTRVMKNSQNATAKWFVGKDYVLCTIQGPQAGEWQIDTAGGRTTKVVVTTDVRLEVTMDPEQTVPGQEVRIAARLAATGDQEPAILSPAELGFMVEVWSPHAAESTTMRMFRQESQPAEQAIGQWFGTVYAPPAAPGEYRGRVIAAAPTFSREKSFVLRVLAPQSALSTAGPLVGIISDSSTPSQVTLAPAVSLPPAAAEESNEQLSSSTSGEAAVAGMAQPRMASVSLASSISGVLFHVAIAHGALLALAGGILTWRRLRKGTWWIQQGSASTPPLSGEGQ